MESVYIICLSLALSLMWFFRMFVRLQNENRELKDEIYNRNVETGIRTQIRNDLSDAGITSLEHLRARGALREGL